MSHSYVYQIEAKKKSANAPGGKIAKAAKKAKVKVIGKDTLSEVWRDMEPRRMELPTWVTPAPSNLGAPKVGKLTADQWRATCTIHLVVTLVRLWGVMDPTSRHYQMLDNFMDLVTAIKIADRRSLTPNMSSDFLFYMHRYLENLLLLYPSVSLTPNQHLSLHFDGNMKRFGPSHAGRCFGIERQNYVLQRIPKNMKHGEASSLLIFQWLNFTSQAKWNKQCLKDTAKVNHSWLL